MKKIDFKKEMKEYFNPSKKAPSIIDIPERRYIMMSSMGDPNTSDAFADGIEALFSVSYTLKFMVKKGKMQIDYGVLPLEGLWWCDDMAQFSTKHKELWKWTIMIMQPDFITSEMYNEAIQTVKKKKKLNKIDDLSLETYTEGLSVQMMHIGPFSTESVTLDKMVDIMASEGLIKSGRHHEIYLNDFRKIAPEKMKTILRQPVKRG